MEKSESMGEYSIKNEVESNDLIKKLKEENKKLKKENERLKLVADAVPCIIHDINNFLTPIVGSVEIVKEEAKNEVRILKSLKIIEECANDGISVSGRLMRHLKGIEAKEEEVVSVNQAVADVIDIMYKRYQFDKYRINFEVKTESDAFIKVNSTEIKELLMNILNNSVDAIKEKGNIYVCTRKKGEFAEIEIKDDGIGMDEKTRLKMFNPYFTTKGDNGMGVGLHICLQMIKKYGGNISCESKLNEGTTIKITFPCCQEKKNIKTAEKKYNFNGKVLIVDDEKQLRDVVSDMIRTVIDCNVEAVSSKEILENINVNEYSVIICDYLMPKINGIQLAEIVKSKNPDIYFCLMTGWVGDFDHKKYDNIDNVLYKPINLNKIKELFHSVQEQNN